MSSPYNGADISDLDPLFMPDKSRPETYSDDVLGSLVPVTSKLVLLSDDEDEDETVETPAGQGEGHQGERSEDSSGLEKSIKASEASEAPESPDAPVPPSKVLDPTGPSRDATVGTNQGTSALPHSPIPNPTPTVSRGSPELPHPPSATPPPPTSPTPLPTSTATHAAEVTFEPIEPARDRPDKSTIKYDFHAFGEQMRQKSAEPINKYFRSFVREFLRQSPTSTSSQVKAVHEFMDFVSVRMRLVDPWKSQLENASDPEYAEEEFDISVDCMEKLIMTRLYYVTFAPAIEHTHKTDEPSATGDIERDAVLAQKIQLFQWVEPRHLDLPVAWLYDSEQEEESTEALVGKPKESVQDVSTETELTNEEQEATESNNSLIDLKIKEEHDAEEKIKEDKSANEVEESTEETTANDEVEQTAEKTTSEQEGRIEGKGKDVQATVTESLGEQEKHERSRSVESDEKKQKLKKQYTSLFAAAQEQLRKINDYRAPRDKMICILNSCKLIFNILRLVSADESADSFIPFLVYLVLQTNPDHLVSNIQYIQRFRSPAYLSGESGYYLSSLSGVVGLIETMDASILSGVTQEEFEAHVEHAIENLNTKRSKVAKKPPRIEPTAGYLSTPTESDEVSPEVVSKSSSYPRLPQFFANPGDHVDRIVSGPLNAFSKVFGQLTGDAPDAPQPNYPLPYKAPQAPPPPPSQYPGSPYRQETRSSRRRHSSVSAMYAPENMTDAQAAEEIERQDSERKTAYLSTLNSMFPSLDSEVFEIILAENSYDLDKTVDTLLEMT